MATIGNLNVRVSAVTGGFTAGLKKAGGSVSSFASFVSGGLVTVGKFAAGIGLTATAGAVGALGLLTRSSLISVDALAKNAKMLDINIGALAGLQRTGERAGVSSEQLVKGIQRMEKTVSDASIGLSTAVRAFDQLGLSADQLKKLSPDEQFFAIAQAMSKVEDQSDRMRIAMDVFGRSGGRMLNLLTQDVEELRKQQERARELGLAVDPKDAANIEAANDSMADFKDSLRGIGNTLAATFAPALKWSADRLTEIGIRGRKVFEFMRPAINAAGNWLIDAFTIGVFAVKNWQSIATIQFMKVKLAALSWYLDVEHFFGVTVPTALDFFATNWEDTLFTIFDFASTVFINLGMNIRNVMKEIWDFIASGGRNKLEFAWTPLTEGFYNAVSDLKLPERQMSEIEKQMQSQISGLETDLGMSLADELDKAHIDLKGFGLDNTNLPDQLDELKNTVQQFDFGLSSDAKKALQLQAQGTGSQATPEEKTAAAVDALQQYARGTLRLTEDMVALLKQQVALTEAEPQPATL